MKAFGGRGNAPLRDDSASRDSVQGDCRDAALTFMAATTQRRGPWDKLALAAWLTGPYARAARHSIHGDRDAILDGDAVVAEALVEDLVERVRSELLASLTTAARAGDGSLDFVEDAVHRQLVRKAIRAGGDEIWIPIDGPRMGLRDRVRSLFAADYMNDPAGYLELFVCGTCAAVLFDEHVTRSQTCPVHRRASGIVPRDRDAGGDVEVDVTVADIAAGAD